MTCLVVIAADVLAVCYVITWFRTWSDREPERVPLWRWLVTKARQEDR